MVIRSVVVWLSKKQWWWAYGRGGIYGKCLVNTTTQATHLPHHTHLLIYPTSGGVGGGGGIKRGVQYYSTSSFSSTKASTKRRQEEWEDVEEEVVEKAKVDQGKLAKAIKEEEPEEGGRRGKTWSWKWRALIWSPIPILTIFSYIEFKRLRDPQHLLRHWEISCYRMLPWRTLSRTWGFVNNMDLPVWARVPFIRWYATTFRVELAEAEVEDLSAYPNLGEFFRRSLKPNARPICAESILVSPADGTLVHAGLVGSSNGMVEQVKGVAYSLQTFLGPNTWASSSSSWLVPPEEYEASLLQHPERNSLYTVVIYLAPGDYHRFHSPVDWRVTHRRHFPGELLSVHPRMARWISGLFTINERAVYVGEWAHGFFSMTAVGATNVGSIRVYADPSLSTNVWGRSQPLVWKDKTLDIDLTKGEQFGEFNLGSTIVLLFEAPRRNYDNVDDCWGTQSGGMMGGKVRVGRPLL